MTPRNYKEIDFEDHIESSLEEQNEFISLSKEYEKDKSIYDERNCLIPSELIEFISNTQPTMWERYKKQYPTNPEKILSNKLTDEVEKRGLIDVLKNGLNDRGCKFEIVYFQPNSGMNLKHRDLFQKNRFVVIRQLHFSPLNPDLSIDMVLFLNGLPVITLELKNSLTGQDHQDSEKQYKRRNINEPLLSFQRCLVHFGVGNEKTVMTTNVCGEETKFFPFNKDVENPVNPNGHKTSYLWEEVLTKESILDLIQNYIHLHKETVEEFDWKQGKVVEKETESLIFPRYPQLRVVRKLKSTLLNEGVGHDYLIQHSTGSGKSLSIGWLSHLLVSLFPDNQSTKRLFDSVIVVTDRKVLDKQINETLQQINKRKGIVYKTTNNKKLFEHLTSGKNIVVTTVQKFPFLMKNFSKELEGELRGKTFGVIIDEVHSSQFGISHKELRKSLTDPDFGSFEEGEGLEDITETDEKIIKELESIRNRDNISFFGFSGTPTNKTLQKFGRKDDQGIPRVFDSYSMDQSIKERFTLNVLKNYTTYQRYFKLNENLLDDPELPSRTVKKQLIKWVDLHPHSISEKTQIILDHLHEHTSKKINNLGKGMLVTQSRLHCVRYKLEFDRQLKERDSPYKSLVGFSGKVFDKDTQQEYTESSMNGFPESQTEKRFKEPRNKILIVNNKFQTGFDEPTLHTMYVDKKMGGLQFVQTLSRINRTITGKTDTFVLDFKNEPSTVKESFQPYFYETELSEDTDPNVLYDRERDIRQYEIFDDEDVENFVNIVHDDDIPMERVQGVLDEIIQNWNKLDDDKKQDFKSNCNSFVNLYTFLSQIISFIDIRLEKLNIFLVFLIKKFPKTTEPRVSNVSELVNLDYFRISKKTLSSIVLEEDESIIDPISDRTSKGLKEEEEELLSEIIETLNKSFGTEVTEDDKIKLGIVEEKLKTNSELRSFFNGDNTESGRRHVFNRIFEEVFLQLVDDDIEFYNKYTKRDINRTLKEGFYRSYLNYSFS